MKLLESINLVFSEHIKNIKQIIEMSKSDLKKQYSGTVFGYFWPLIKNLIFVFAYWFTIEIGLKGGARSDYPYIVWLVVGLTPWFFIRDTLAPAAASIRKNKYLVTKMIYPISTIPTFKILSGFIGSITFMLVTTIIAALYSIYPSIYWIQIIYYSFACIVLLISISLITSALVVVSRDIEFLINSIIILVFWVTPILWPIKNVPQNLIIIVKLNPFFYVVEGFRNSILYGTWFWEQPILTLYFWGFTMITFILGALIHGKLRPQFADIL
jgi:ABC-type polysaccharide/polyol phosphate export permease